MQVMPRNTGSQEWEARALERAQGLKQYLETMSGQSVAVNVSRNVNGSYAEPRVYWSNTGRTGNNGQWRVTIFSDSLETEDVMRLAAEVLFTITAGLIESVTKRMTDSRVRDTARAIEKARTEWLGDFWFKSNLATAKRTELLAQELAFRNNKMESSYNKDITQAINKVLYDIPGEFTNPAMADAIAKFGDRIKTASRSLNQADSLNIAVEIADYLKWLEQPPTPPPPGGDQDSDDESGNAGGESSTSPGTGSGFEPSGSGSENKNRAYSYKDSDGAQESDYSEYQEENGADLKRQITNLKRNITRNKKKGVEQQKQNAVNAEARRQTQLRGYNANQNFVSQRDMDSEYRNAHNVRVQDWPGETIVLDNHTQLALSTFMGNRISPNKLYKRGSIAPLHAWKLVHKGDMRVFRRPPVIRGDVSILVDISGSMGCWCASCQSGEHGAMENLPSYLSWQVAGLLGRLHPTAEVFTYCGDSKDTKVIPLEAGQHPAGCARRDGLSGGTPTCSAMMYFREHLMSRPSNTTAIIITDGAPDYCVSNGQHHVDHLGAGMLAQGIKFGTVFIGQGQYLNLPSEVSVNISRLDDIASIQPLLETLDC